MQIFLVSVERIYRSLLYFNVTLYLVCREPKYHCSSVSPDPVLCKLWNWPKSYGIYIYIYIFSTWKEGKGMVSTWKEGKGMVKESESVTDTPPDLEQNTQTNPMSVRGEPAATRCIVCNFTLPSPFELESRGLNDCKGSWGEQKLEFYFWFWNY